MPDYNALVVIDQQAEKMRVKSGGVIELEAGGELLNSGSVVKNAEAVAANFTLTRADSGKVYLVNTADLVITLPATVAGLKYTFTVEAAALSVSTGLSISPNALDMIMGNGFAGTDNKDAINTGASDAEGDLLTLVGDGVLGWYITEILGTWALE